MRIQYNEVKTHEINIPRETVKEITVARLKEFLDYGEFLRTVEKDGKTVVYLKKDEDGWRHGSVSEEIVREATELDKAVFVLLDALKNSK